MHKQVYNLYSRNIQARNKDALKAILVVSSYKASNITGIRKLKYCTCTPHPIRHFLFYRVLVDCQTRQGVEQILSAFTYDPDKMRALQILGTVSTYTILCIKLVYF